jgi:uncharacterized membrane protein
MDMMPRWYFSFAARDATVIASKPKLVQTIAITLKMETVMNNTKMLVSSALTALAALAVTSSIANSGPAPKPTFESEKCYGISKAGLNDCQTSTHSCAGTATRDNQADSWVYVPTGTCTKLTGGSNMPKV